MSDESAELQVLREILVQLIKMRQDTARIAAQMDAAAVEYGPTLQRLAGMMNGSASARIKAALGRTPHA